MPKLDLKQTEIAAIKKAVNYYFNHSILAPAVKKKKPFSSGLSFEDSVLVNVKEFLDKNF